MSDHLPGVDTSSVQPSPAEMRRQNEMFAERARTGWVLVTPAALLVLVFFIAPLVLMIWMSFHQWPLIGQERFNAGQNYAELATDRLFWKSLLFTVVYTVVATPPHLLTGYALALLVRGKVRGVAVFRAAYFLPVVVGFATASYVFLVLVRPEYHVISWLGLEDVLLNWQTNPILSVTLVVILVSWKTAGVAMVLYMAGMQAISDEIIEAAQVDGANWWQREVRIILPLLKRTHALVLILGVAGSFLIFEPFFILTQGGPSNATLTSVMWIYTTSFIHYRLGYGATLSMVLMVIVVMLSIAQLVLLRDKEARQ